MAHVVNPDNLDDDDDAVFAGLLSQGLIWIEEDEDDEDYLMEDDEDYLMEDDEDYI